ncbi:hypothetical protein SAMN05444354_13728 [Stigmatella aurantiaca]|uniref:Lipoprotein n=1 Tax=Stigmatella aurantiaca TaxID=41 RepID=A0A1H8FGP3_STIAU|nr:hypothetical protein [Stigmatella aurantiaca]SEN30786.1 hypothetical protein SAMN05444354_13728 [Stigmatella aurantiaca]
MNRFRALLSLVGCLLLAGCGGDPADGESCEGGGYVCASKAEALECRQGQWRAIPCRGSQGCQESGDTIRCDTSSNLAGDNCGSSAEGRGLCRIDGLAVLECRLGVLVEAETCRSCSASGEQIICEQ